MILITGGLGLIGSNLASLFLNPKAEDLVRSVKNQIPNTNITFTLDLKSTQTVKTWPKYMAISRVNEDFGLVPKFSSLDLIVKDFVNEVRQNFNIYNLKKEC